MTALRIAPAELAEIDARARKHDMSRSSYMIAASLGTLNISQADVDRRLGSLEARLSRLEEFAIGQ
jgi:hypothetical protein